MTASFEFTSSLAQALSQTARSCAGRVALAAPGREPLSHEGLWLHVRTFAQSLRELGVDAGGRVAVVLPNGPEMATTFLAIASSAVCAPLNPGYRQEEFAFYLEDLHAQLLIVARGEGQAARAAARGLGIAIVEIESDSRGPAGLCRLGALEGRLAPSAAGRAEEVALILHTSGTTARPKIVPLSSANLVASGRNIARHLALGPDDVCLNVMPLFHIHGLIGTLLASVLGGSTIVCTPGFDDQTFFDWIGTYRPSWYSAVPTIHQAIVAQGEHYRRKAPGHRFRFVRSSSAALPPRTLQALEMLLDAPVVEAYGMTEATHQMTSNPLPPGARKTGSVGVAAGAQIALLDEAGRILAAGGPGEIVIRGDGVITGYENNPAANAGAFASGWFRTGDQGRIDEDGYLFISGRLKEIVNRGGEKVSPREIDERLLEHPDVAQAVAFAVPHATLGEDLAAAVVLRSGAVADEAALRLWLLEQLAAFKVPSSICFVDAIPKGPTGKVQRTALHAKLGDRLAREFVPASTDSERLVAGLMVELLGVERAGIHDNFFALGGDSLKGTQLVARVNREAGLDLAVGALFRYPTAATLAAEIDREIEAGRAHEDALAAEIDQLSDEEVLRLLAAESAAQADPAR